ncbi:hypothetical protein B0H14DRAFT_3029048 [Mycena olivaceomarginata]|nr:hypothetical protein B0H14DRAFT_3029048 [Mycena olivaceomarginata]
MLLKLVTAGPIRMPSIIVSEAHTRAEVLCAFCEATPAKKAYQPSASAACKICVLARPDPQRRLSFLATRSVSSLAAHAVKKTDAAIMNGQEHLPSSEVVHALHTFERTLDMIIHHIQPITGHATGSPRPRFSSFHFLRESAHLKAELNRAYEHLLQSSKQSAIAAAFIVPNDGALEVATLTTQAVGIVCEFPILNVLKPVALMAALICDRARTAQSNHKAALLLAVHSTFPSTTSTRGEHAEDENSMRPLRLVLGEIQAFLEHLQKRRRPIAGWIFAKRDEDRFKDLNDRLDRLLIMFIGNQVVTRMRCPPCEVCNLNTVTNDSQ